MDLAVTEMNSMARITLTQQYAAATSEAQRSALVAAANYALANLPLATFFSFFVSSIGWLIFSMVMLKGIFSRPSAWGGTILSIMGIAGSFYGILPVLGLFLTPCLVAFGIWCLLVGSRLFKLSKAIAINRTTPVAVPN